MRKGRLRMCYNMSCGIVPYASKSNKKKEHQELKINPFGSVSKSVPRHGLFRAILFFRPQHVHANERSLRSPSPQKLCIKRAALKRMTEHLSSRPPRPSSSRTLNRVEVGFDYVVAAELAPAEPTKVEEETRSPVSEVANTSGTVVSGDSTEGAVADVGAGGQGKGGDAEGGEGVKANGDVDGKAAATAAGR